MKTFAGVEELQAAVGTHLGTSKWHTITQEQINLFAEATGDHQWIHTHAEKAASGRFGAPVAHGYLTLSMLPLFTREVYRVEGRAMAINYGANRVRFPSPVRVGSRVRARIDLTSVTAASRGTSCMADHSPINGRGISSSL